MKSRYLCVAAVAVAALLSPIGNVEACGPDFEPDLFVRTAIPDDPAEFAQGRLGILQAGYDSDEYAVAFRYLNGGKLSAAELRAYARPGPGTANGWYIIHPTTAQLAELQTEEQQNQQNVSQPEQWPQARVQFAPLATSVAPGPSPSTFSAGNIVFDESYLDCPEPAFRNAVLTLNMRTAEWGKQSPWLADWIRAQDAVFSNCAGGGGNIPAPAPADGPALLKADRAYQLASATFYAGQFDDAARQFAAIAADHSSPWSSWGDYLAARATVRKAFAMGKATDPYGGELATYDSATMLRAQQMLEAILAQPNPAPSRAIVQDELNLVLIRTDPRKRADELSTAFAGPQPDANFSQDLQDLSWILMKQISIQNPPPLLAWIAAWRGSGTAANAYATWQQDHSLPWLVIAIAKADPSDSFVPDLIAEAEKIAPGTPAYDTVFYHRVRLLTGLNRADEARKLLDAALSALGSQKPSSERNALLGERMAVARDFNEFLKFAPRNTLETGSEGAQDLQGQCDETANAAAHAVQYATPCPGADNPQEFDEDAITILNQQTPTSLLIQAAQSQSLPPNLRQALVIVAWTRAVLLEDTRSSAALAPLLPKALNSTAESGVGFPADLTILRNPGIRPYLEPGIPRVASYNYFDEFRNNWWCKNWQVEYSNEDQRPIPPPPPTPTIISSRELAQGAAEYQRLQQIPDSAALIGQRVIDYAKQHPDDPEVPEALALTVRATHYACQTYQPNQGTSTATEYTPVSKAAFEFLHQHYPKSPWTAKTPYYY